MSIQESTENYFLLMLAKMKWGDNFCCVRCGNETYGKGKKEFSRRCKKCRLEESLRRHTVFDGLKIPMDIGCKILDEIKDVASTYSHGQFDVKGRGLQQFDTIWEFVKIRNDRKQANKWITEDIVAENLNSYHLSKSIRQLSKKYKIEENTIGKFLDRVNKRIPLEEIQEGENSYDRVFRFLLEFAYDWSSEDMYRLMMLIIPTDFTYGAFDINNKTYGIYIDVWGYDEIRKSYYKPALCEAEYIEAQYIDGNLGEYSEYHYNIVGESIDYGSEEWKGIFCEKYNS